MLLPLRTHLRVLGLVVAALCACALTAQAQEQRRSPRLTLDPDSDLVEQVVIGGASEGGTPRLMDVAVGDLDGDGIDDLVFGAPGADPNDLVSAGSVYILFGRSDLIGGQRQRDLSRVDAFDLRIDGAVPGARLGYRVAIADVDGDGLGDLIATAPGRRGAVYIKLGKKNWPRGTMVLGPSDTWDVALVGPADGSLLGASLCVGDLDYDRRAEIAFASLGFDDTGKVVSTDLHLLPGRAEWQRQAVNITGRLAGRTLLTRRVAPTTRVTFECAMGELDDNGSGDLVVTLPHDRGSSDELEQAGSVAVVLDVMTLSGSTIDLADEKVSWGYRILGTQAGARLGASVAIADLNGDQRNDLVLGSPERLVVGPESEGAVHILWGGLLPRRGTTTALAADLTLVGNGGRFGAVLTTADLNGDSRADLIVGSPGATNAAGERAGQLDVFVGGPHLNEPGDAVRRDKRIIGGGLRDGLGFALAAGDLDGDGAVELVARAAGNALERREAGSIHIVNAELASIPTEGTIDDLLPLTLIGPGRGGRLSARVLRRDLDGDGREELLWASPEGAGHRGLVCVVDQQPQMLDLSDPSHCPLRILGPVDRLLTSFDAGDVDGDGRMEVVLGFDGRDFGGEIAGPGAVLAARLPEGELRGELVLDVPEKPGALAAGGPLVRAWLAGPNAEGLGARVDVADLDGDGLAEVIMGAERASWEDRPQAGAVFVAAGASGDAERRAWSVVSKTEPGVRLRFEGTDGARLGRSTQVLDLDGDGKRDLAMAAPLASLSGEEERGAVYVIYDVAGLSAGMYSVSDPDIVSLQVVGAKRGAGLVIESALDLDGDGADDLVLLSPWEAVEALQHGAGYVLYGTVGRRRGSNVMLGEDSSADLRVLGERGMQLNGLRFADLDGDGRLELIATSRPHTRPELRPSVSLLSLEEAGRTLGTVSLARDGSATVVIENRAGGAALSLAEPMLDADGDGQVELWLFESTADVTLSDQGAALRLSPRVLNVERTASRLPSSSPDH